LTSEEILCTMALVNKKFYFVSLDAKLWRELCFRDFDSKMVEKSVLKFKKQDLPDWYRCYQFIQKLACFQCKSDEGTDIKICPIEKKPLCKECRTADHFTLLTVEQISNYYNPLLSQIFDSAVQKKAYRYDGEYVYYKKDVELALVAYNLFISDVHTKHKT
jgi:hypothetical protein